MAPHKRAASLLQISSALVSHQLLLLLIGKENVEDGDGEVREVEEEEEEKKDKVKEDENVMSPRDEGDEMVRRRRRRREEDGEGKDEMSELGNNDLVEILASLGLLTSMMETVLDSLNSRIGTDKM